MVDQWMVRVTFGWSIYEVVSNDNETTSQCVIYVQPVPKNMRLWFQIIQSLGKFNRCLSNAAKPYLSKPSHIIFQSAWLEYLKAQLHSLESSRDMRDLPIRCIAMNRGPVSVSQLFNSMGKKIIWEFISCKTDYPTCNYGSSITIMGHIWRLGDHLWTALYWCHAIHYKISNISAPNPQTAMMLVSSCSCFAMFGKLLTIMLNTSSDGVTLHKPCACPHHNSSPIQNRITKFGSEDWGPKHLFKIPIQLKNSEYHYVLTVWLANFQKLVKLPKVSSLSQQCNFQ